MVRVYATVSEETVVSKIARVIDTNSAAGS